MTKPFVLIGLTGLANAGKDTAADLLVTHQGFTKMAFADALYAEVAEAYCVDVRFLMHRETKEHPLSALALARCSSDLFVARLIVNAQAAGQPLDLQAPRSPRQILQLWGTEYRRHQQPRYWIDGLTRRIQFNTGNCLGHRFVITDCRFPDEAAKVREFGGRIWQIKRTGVGPASTGHVSETTGDDFHPDAILHNDYDIRHLQQLVLGEFWAHDAGLASVTVQISD
ncbi:MAG: hypothetical protein I8H71_00275 [Xanthomonadaceae bacterium]|nr:hypothetical protein [Xanthomonadaceae bacterium]MBH2008108.1 hypothetical protein [Xanthomonadaceae bacterium]